MSSPSLILIVSIYAGAQFGGAVPAILVNVPGEAGAVVTALDGYQFTKRGEFGLAIGIARMAAAIGGVVGGVVVLVLLGPLGEFALSFGARELFVVILLGFVVASSLMGESVRKGLMVGLRISAEPRPHRRWAGRSSARWADLRVSEGRCPQPGPCAGSAACWAEQAGGTVAQLVERLYHYSDRSGLKEERGRRIRAA